MKRMYVKPQTVEGEEPDAVIAEHGDDKFEKRLRVLESRVAQMADQMRSIHEAVELARRAIRRQNGDLNILTNKVYSHK